MVYPEDIDGEGSRRIICAILLQAIKDMRCLTEQNRYNAWKWIKSSQAKQYAALVGLEHQWPPEQNIFLED